MPDCRARIDAILQRRAGPSTSSPIPSGCEFLKPRIVEHGLALEAFDWHLGLRRYGSVPHSGFGMGIERMMKWTCGLRHIRETLPFARAPLCLSP